MRSTVPGDEDGVEGGKGGGRSGNHGRRETRPVARFSDAMDRQWESGWEHCYESRNLRPTVGAASSPLRYETIPSQVATAADVGTVSRSQKSVRHGVDRIHAKKKNATVSQWTSRSHEESQLGAWGGNMGDSDLSFPSLLS